MKSSGVWLAGLALLVTAVTPVVAIMASARSLETLEQRLTEIDASLVQIQTGLTQQSLEPSKQTALRELHKSLEAEKQLLVQRRESLRQLEAQGLLMYVSPPEAKKQ